MGKDQIYTTGTYIWVVFLVSGIVWVPYVLLLSFLFREHSVRKRYPQNLILLFLFFGAVFRCIWFFIYFPLSNDLGTQILNRVAILMQFSAISILALMWSRVLKITSEADKITSARFAVATAAERVNSIKSANESILAKVDADKKQLFFIRITILANIVVWGVILCSLSAESDRGWYNVNLILLSVLCLVVALVTLFVGISTSLKLKNELQPVYIASNNNMTLSSMKQTRWDCWGWGCCGVYAIYDLVFKSPKQLGLQLQREVLRTLLSVSLIVCFFFLLRSFAFMYRPVIVGDAHDMQDNKIASQILYPFFFYQLPETLPNLAIAVGISPPNGVLRRYFMPFLARCCLFEYCGIYNVSLYSGATAAAGGGSGGESKNRADSVQDYDEDVVEESVNNASKPQTSRSSNSVNWRSILKRTVLSSTDSAPRPQNHLASDEKSGGAEAFTQPHTSRSSATVMAFQPDAEDAAMSAGHYAGGEGAAGELIRDSSIISANNSLTSNPALSNRSSVASNRSMSSFSISKSANVPIPTNNSSRHSAGLALLSTSAASNSRPAVNADNTAANTLANSATAYSSRTNTNTGSNAVVSPIHSYPSQQTQHSYSYGQYTSSSPGVRGLSGDDYQRHREASQEFSELIYRMNSFSSHDGTYSLINALLRRNNLSTASASTGTSSMPTSPLGGRAQKDDV